MFRFEEVEDNVLLRGNVMEKLHLFEFIRQTAWSSDGFEEMKEIVREIKGERRARSPIFESSSEEEVSRYRGVGMSRSDDFLSLDG